MRLQAGCRVHRVQRRVCNYFAFFTEFNWIWTGGAHSHTPHRHTLTHTLNCKHTQTFTHTHTETHTWPGGEMLIKWTGSNVLAGPFAVLRRALPLPHCITLAFLLHGISASTPPPLARSLPLTLLYFPTWQHWAPPGSAVVQNIIWHCILSSVFFWRN